MASIARTSLQFSISKRDSYGVQELHPAGPYHHWNGHFCSSLVFVQCCRTSIAPIRPFDHSTALWNIIHRFFLIQLTLTRSHWYGFEYCGCDYLSGSSTPCFMSCVFRKKAFLLDAYSCMIVSNLYQYLLRYVQTSRCMQRGSAYRANPKCLNIITYTTVLVAFYHFLSWTLFEPTTLLSHHIQLIVYPCFFSVLYQPPFLRFNFNLLHSY